MIGNPKGIPCFYRNATAVAVGDLRWSKVVIVVVGVRDQHKIGFVADIGLDVDPIEAGRVARLSGVSRAAPVAALYRCAPAGGRRRRQRCCCRKRRAAFCLHCSKGM